MRTITKRIAGALAPLLAASVTGTALADGRSHHAARASSYVATAPARAQPAIRTRTSPCPAWLKGHCPSAHGSSVRTRTSGSDDGGGRGHGGGHDD
jgi:hypothetical protein